MRMGLVLYIVMIVTVSNEYQYTSWTKFTVIFYHYFQIVRFIKMSGSESELERLSSVEGTKESFDVVPYDQEYKVKIYAWTGKFLVKFVYPLKKGKDLPYTRELKGK